jgi:transposase
MEYGAIDLHTRRSHVRILDEDGAIVLERRIDTTRAELTRLFGSRPRLRVLVESGTDSEWVAQCLEGCGHDVIVADPNYLPMYGARRRRVKTDRRDVASLADACRQGFYRRAHRVSAGQRTVRQTLRARTHCVRVRTGTISVLRALVRQEGVRVPSGRAETLLARVSRVPLPAGVAAAVAPLCELLTQVGRIMDIVDAQVTRQAAEDPVVRRLMTAPGVGPVVALTYRAVLDDPARFQGDTRRASAYLG